MFENLVTETDADPSQARDQPVFSNQKKFISLYKLLLFFLSFWSRRQKKETSREQQFSFFRFVFLVFIVIAASSPLSRHRERIYLRKV